jgi:hypothetical protein
MALAAEALPESDRDSQILSLAQASFEEASANRAKLDEILQHNCSNAFWPIAIPLEPFGNFENIDLYECEHSVVACDGSQIMPTQHEVHSCFLLNVGAVVLHYGEKSQAQLLSFPYLYHRHDDLYPLINQRRFHIDEALVSFERGLKELEQSFELACAEAQKGHKVLTLVDGSLIPFNVDKHADGFQKNLLERFESQLESFSREKLPLIGYISHSRSSDLVNMLRVWNCPFPESRCKLYCGSINEEEFPCSQIWPLSDRQLLVSKLPKFARSNFFRSGSRWSTGLSHSNQICFSYFNIGQEAARIEIPFWLLEDKSQLKFALSTLRTQIKKGQGYPISLAEAHNMAVIRQADRSHFYQLVTAELLREKQAGIGLSPKESKKRQSII